MKKKHNLAEFRYSKQSLYHFMNGGAASSSSLCRTKEKEKKKIDAEIISSRN